jgi:formylglycine-generating enzyme required for sulfatase activity
MSDTLDRPGAEVIDAAEAHTAGACFSDGPALPEMVVVPQGKFWMGADDEGDKFASSVEKPRHWVEIPRTIAVSRYPVTFEQWDAYADGNAETHRPDDRGWGRGRRPVVNVSWEDAQEYVTWLSMSAGRAYRLLSEAEWEYCCRGGAGGVFSTGSTITVKDANFLYMDYGDRPGLGAPVPVGSYRPNGFGLFDMHGNVCELVADSWHDNYRGAPTDGTAWGQTEATMWRVVRGGGWDALPRILRCPFRDWVHHTKRMDNLGFRVACDLR